MGFPIDNSLKIDKKEEESVLKKGIYKDEKISNVEKFNTNFIKKMLISSGLG